jgi:hypothetical protein
VSIDRILSIALLVALGVVVLGWLAQEAIGELSLLLEYRRPSGRPPERGTCRSRR